MYVPPINDSQGILKELVPRWHIHMRNETHKSFWESVPAHQPPGQGHWPCQATYHGVQSLLGLCLWAPLEHSLEQQWVLGDALVGLDEQVPQMLPP